MTLVLEPLPDSELVLGGAKQTGDLDAEDSLLASCISFPQTAPRRGSRFPKEHPALLQLRPCVCFVCVCSSFSGRPPQRDAGEWDRSARPCD